MSGKPPGRILDFAGLWAVSGTAEDGPESFRGFVTLRSEASNGDVLLGQLPPAEVRALALSLLSAAEAADQDAIVFTIMVRDLGLPPEAVAGLVTAMRAERGDPDPPL
jgi:hypothetical protein